jgi:hypothetical protein
MSLFKYLHLRPTEHLFGVRHFVHDWFNLVISGGLQSTLLVKYIHKPPG